MGRFRIGCSGWVGIAVRNARRLRRLLEGWDIRPAQRRRPSAFARAGRWAGMEIQPSASPALLLQAERLDTVREVVAEQQQAGPRPVEDIVELSVAAQQLAAGGGA